MKLHHTLAATIVAAAVVPFTHAAFVVPDGNNYSWVRGTTTNSAYAEWDRFTTAAGPNLPDVNSVAVGTLAGGSWNVFNRNSGSIVTGSGNIYAPMAVVAPQVDVPSFNLGVGAATTILLQVRTQGFEINPASVNIDGIAPVQTGELLRQSAGPGGFIVETYYRFDLSGNAASYTIRFEAAATSMSLDRIAVDTYTVIPAPASLGLLGSAVCLRRRRR